MPNNNTGYNLRGQQRDNSDESDLTDADTSPLAQRTTAQQPPGPEPNRSENCLLAELLT
jgi:hypothetical protein